MKTTAKYLRARYASAAPLIMLCYACFLTCTHAQAQSFAPPEQKLLSPRQEAQNALSSPGKKILVVDVLSVSGQPWNNGNPPKAQLRVCEALIGPASGKLNALWEPPTNHLSGSEAFVERGAKQWLSLPMNGPTRGQKLIAIGEFGALGEFRVSNTMPFSAALRSAFLAEIAALKREQQKSRPPQRKQK